MAMTKQKYSIKSIRARVTDTFRSHSEDIEKNTPLRFGAGVFGEMKFLLDEIDRRDGKSLELHPGPDEVEGEDDEPTDA